MKVEWPALIIIALARKLFASRGYNATSTEAVLDESKVSRGTLYHHFDSKEALFASVLEAVEVDITVATGRAWANTDDPVEALGAAFDGFLDMASESQVRQIVLTDAHSVLGWQKWREIEDRHVPKHRPQQPSDGVSGFREVRRLSTRVQHRPGLPSRTRL